MNIRQCNCCEKASPCPKCGEYEFCVAWASFVKNHSEIKKYAHFDNRVSLAMPSIIKYVLNTEKIAHHSFYPFIHFTKTMSKFRKGKRKPKNRELYYCSHLDRCVYQRYAFLLNYHYNQRVKQEGINSVAIAYRDKLGKNNIDFAKWAFDFIKANDDCWILVGDFTNFFDRLNHNYLKNKICQLLNIDRLPDDYFAIFKNITRFAFWEWHDIVEANGFEITEKGIRAKLNSRDIVLGKEKFTEYKKRISRNMETRGIPQGSPISATLSNIYMLDFDVKMNQYVSSLDGLYLRYSDDFIVIIPQPNSAQRQRHEEFVHQCVAMVDDLDLQPDKTISYTYQNKKCIKTDSQQQSAIDYLGFVFDGQDIRIRPKSITKYYYRMRRKAKHIGETNWTTSKNTKVSAKRLYEVYSKGKDRQTFINYAQKATQKLELNDPEASALIKHHKRKISQAIKAGERNRRKKTTEKEQT